MLSDARESTNRVKKGVVKEFFSEIVPFLVKKWSYTTFNRVKKGKIRKTWSMTKKEKERSSEFLGVKIENFSEKSPFRNFGPRKTFSVPQTRRQVSATGVYYRNARTCYLRAIKTRSMVRLSRTRFKSAKLTRQAEDHTLDGFILSHECMYVCRLCMYACM